MPPQTSISIHAPREGCDRYTPRRKTRALAFQSTHPVRGATPDDLSHRFFVIFQSTHPVRGATLTDTVSQTRILISIHAPREGCDRA